MKKKILNVEQIKLKQDIIIEYIKEIQSHQSLLNLLPNFIFYDNNFISCDDCKIQLIEYEYENNYICPNCFLEKTEIYHQEDFSYKDLTRINTNIKYSYIRETHFKDTIKQFQGKQNKYIHPDVYKILENYFISSNLGHKNEHGKYTSITKDHIKMFLQQNDLYKYYEDISLIYKNLTGNPCPNIEEYEKSLIDDFNRLILIYDEIIKNNDNYERSNFLNSYYILYQLLKRYGYSCKESDFPIIKTIDRKIEHDEIYEKCCKKLSWRFFPTM